jgi:hypothetical protein
MAAPEVLIESRKAFDEAIVDYEIAEEYYDGDCGDVFASSKMRRLLHKSGADGVEDFNYAQIPVNAIANRLRILHVTGVRPDREQEGETDGEVDAADAAVQEAIDQIIKFNDLRQEWHGLHRSASKYGDCYKHVYPVMEKDKVVAVDILVKQPTRVRLFYDDDNPLEKSHAIEVWEIIDADGLERVRINLWYPDHVERWITKPKLKGAKPDEWIHYTQSDDPNNPDDGLTGWKIDYPAGLDEVPFFHFRNDRPYGQPEHLSAYGPQQMINKLITGHAASIDFQTFPQRYMLMDPEATDRMSNLLDQDHPDDEDDDPESTDGGSPLRADPAAVWRLWAKGVGQFEPANPDMFMSPLDRYIRSMSELTGIPLFRFGIGGTPSGQALAVEKSQENDRVEDRQEAYGPVHAAAFELALSLLGFGEVEVSVVWKPVRTADDADAWALIQQKIATGVPVREAMIEAGYQPEQVDDWLNEPGSALMIQKMALMNQIGTFIQAASAGVATGVVTSETVRSVVDMVLGANQSDIKDDLQEDGSLQPLPPKPEPPPAPPALPPGGAGANGGGSAARQPARTGGARA